MAGPPGAPFASGLCVRIANPPVKFDWKAAFASPRVGPVGGAADASVPPSSTNPATAAATANNVRFFIHLLDARTPTTPSQDRLAKLHHRHFRPTGRVSAGPGEYQRPRNFFGVRGHHPCLEFRAWTIPRLVGFTATSTYLLVIGPQVGAATPSGAMPE